MRKIIYTRPDGRMVVLHPVRNTKGERLTTDEEIEQRAWEDIPSDAINPQWVDESSIPTDRTFRNAWKAGNCCVEHDMDKCRELHKEKLRQLRAPKLAALDVEYMQADEAGDIAKKAQIAAKKRALRDVTKDPLIESAQTPEDLKVVIPVALQ